uniref:hypothetical protein n=1 Tax=Paractinoplanes polyasparticus TaxID=2856853 RepID=UPI001C85E865|nr:hypothetical protein [Actinoplanes polyasparticus]
MKVTVYDVDQPDREIDGKYTIDTTLGAPMIGDELFVGERDYNPDKPLFAGVVRRRSWRIFSNAPHGGELRLWIQRQTKP